MSNVIGDRFYREKPAELGQSDRTIAERTQAEMNDVADAEREACIAILEDLRPRNDRSDWTAWALARDEALTRAIALISARYDVPTRHRPNPFANDVAAKALYDTWAEQPGWVPWVECGNSDKQEEARQQVSL